MIFDSAFHVDVPNEDVLTFLFRSTRFKDNDPIWIDAERTDLKVTLLQARDLTHRIGRGLRNLGIGQHSPGQDVVLSFVENQVLVAPSVFGILCAGGIHAVCPMTATAFEVARQIGICDPKILICSKQTRAVAEDALQKSGKRITLLIMDSEVSDMVQANGQSILNAQRLDWEVITDSDVLERRTACLVFSSGTTGTPKGVRITHTNIVSNLCQMAYHFDHFAKRAISEGKHLRIAGVMQNAVVAGIVVHSFMSLQTGSQVYLFKKFDFHFLMKCIREFELSALFIVPAIWNRMVNEYGSKDLSSVRFAMSGASPLPIGVQKRMMAILPEGVALRVNWGMTETTCGATQPGTNEVDTEGSVGRLLPNMQAVFLDASDRKVQAGQEGELCIKGPNIIKEYFNNPTATTNAYTDDGWFRTGDIGMISEGGKIFIKGRSKELLKYKSHQISPPELEAVLGQHHAVADVGIIGIPDGEGNELPRAYVVCKENSTCSARDIHDFLDPQISRYKRLRGGVVFVDEIPRNLNGKVMRDVLKAWAKGAEASWSKAKL